MIFINKKNKILILMGCNEAKAQIPTIICFFETANEEQKNYCLKLKDNFHHEKSVRYEIKSAPGKEFSIQLKYKDIIHNIQSVFNDGEVEMNNCLNKMYKILNN